MFCQTSESQTSGSHAGEVPDAKKGNLTTFVLSLFKVYKERFCVPRNAFDHVQGGFIAC